VTWTAASFKSRWPEFVPIEDARVEAVLAEAALETDARVYGQSYDHAVGLLAAHKLAISPGGMQARLESKDGSTTYGKERAALSRKRGGGPWVTGYRPGRR
jgi:hypothetical protein